MALHFITVPHTVLLVNTVWEGNHFLNLNQQKKIQNINTKEKQIKNITHNKAVVYIH